MAADRHGGRARFLEPDADGIRRIQAKVRGNVIVPSELAGNPEAIFEVVQLPTGEIIEATLRKSNGISGIRIVSAPPATPACNAIQPA